MCILTFCKPGVSPDLDILAAGAAANPHGHGYALITGHRITVGKSLDPDRAITEFAALRAEFPDGPALFHSRLATHGHLAIDNCHPFPIGGDERTVLAHNGILPPQVHPRTGDPRSDTRVAAEDFLPRQPFGSLDSWTGRLGFEQWLRSDKAVILTVDPSYKHRAYLFNEHHGHWRDGTWYSNYSYLDTGTFWQFCEMCESFLTRNARHCPYCGHCLTCYHPVPRCVCPRSSARNHELLYHEPT